MFDILALGGYSFTVPQRNCLTAILLVSAVCMSSHVRAASYIGFADPAGLVLQADAAVVDGKVRLTPARKAHRGGVWLAQEQNVDAGFDTQFEFQITDQCHYGGNGFSFVMQNNPTPSLGGYGHNAGFWGLSNAVAVNFRTYHYLRNNFVKFDEISVLAGDLRVWSSQCTNCIATVTNVPYSDHAVHTARLVYTRGELSVYVDNLSAPVLTASVDLNERLKLNGAKAWVGFTAATGGDCQNHDLLSWSFENVGNPTVAKGINLPDPSPVRPTPVAAATTRPVYARQADTAQATPLPHDKNLGHAVPAEVGLTHVIEASTDMIHWKQVTNVKVYFEDVESTNYDHRFYRFKQK